VLILAGRAAAPSPLFAELSGAFSQLLAQCAVAKYSFYPADFCYASPFYLASIKASVLPQSTSQALRFKSPVPSREARLASYGLSTLNSAEKALLQPLTPTLPPEARTVKRPAALGIPKRKRSSVAMLPSALPSALTPTPTTAESKSFKKDNKVNHMASEVHTHHLPYTKTIIFIY
jgi:hypothetical protein